MVSGLCILSFFFKCYVKKKKIKIKKIKIKKTKTKNKKWNKIHIGSDMGIHE